LFQRGSHRKLFTVSLLGIPLHGNQGNPYPQPQLNA